METAKLGRSFQNRAEMDARSESIEGLGLGRKTEVKSEIIERKRGVMVHEEVVSWS